MSLIDWNKPLECDGGNVTRINEAVNGVYVEMGERHFNVRYWVYLDGKPMNGELPYTFTVRNEQSNRDKAIKAIEENRMNPCTIERDIDILIKAGLIEE